MGVIAGGKEKLERVWEGKGEDRKMDWKELRIYIGRSVERGAGKGGRKEGKRVVG